MPQFRVQFQVLGTDVSVEQLVEAKDEREGIGLGWLAIAQDKPRAFYRAYHWRMLVFGQADFEITVAPELPTIDSKADVA